MNVLAVKNTFSKCILDYGKTCVVYGETYVVDGKTCVVCDKTCEVYGIVSNDGGYDVEERRGHTSSGQA